MAISDKTPVEPANRTAPSVQAIRHWVAQADRNAGQRSDVLSSSGKEELARLLRENRQLRQERDIPANLPFPGQVRTSMGSVGDAYDNAMCESFFATPEGEPLDRRRFCSRAEACVTVFTVIEGGYKPCRRLYTG